LTALHSPTTNTFFGEDEGKDMRRSYKNESKERRRNEDEEKLEWRRRVETWKLV
jgi:hypothetical protein